MVAEIGGNEILELDSVQSPVELAGGKTQPVELPADLDYKYPIVRSNTTFTGKEVVSSGHGSTTGTSTTDDLLSEEEKTSISQTFSGDSAATRATTYSPISPETPNTAERTKSDNKFSKSTRKWSSKFSLRKSKTTQE